LKQIDKLAAMKYDDESNSFKEIWVMFPIAALFIEAAVVGIVCLFFLLLMVVAGVKQIFDDRE